ncbi:AbrB family transcriptional regulator [Macrococcus equi]|uniref:AbrB family transcriptional regulator n=2 Tax=Macrococcus equi TaxID=3395462 RepID=UPI0039BE3689
MMSYLLLFLTSFIFGLLLNNIGMILPWLFGSIGAALFLKRFTPLDYHWPKWLGEIGLYILGAQIGVTFTKEILGDIANDFVSIVTLSILIIISAVTISFLFKKIVGCSTETALLASIPGALNQMIVLADENKHASILIVTMTQTSRLLFVIMLVPFISSFTSEKQLHPHLSKAEEIYQLLNPEQIIFVLCMIAVSIFILKKIHFPVPDMLGPVIAILLWNLTTGLNFSVPMPLINFAQILFGIKIGLQMYNLSHQLSKRLFAGIFVQNVLLIVSAIIFSVLFTGMSKHTFNDLFLSAAPGGMAQIIIVALETGANVAMISSFHIFRIFFILLIITPLMAWYLKKSESHSHREVD